MYKYFHPGWCELLPLTNDFFLAELSRRSPGSTSLSSSSSSTSSNWSWTSWGNGSSCARFGTYDLHFQATLHWEAESVATQWIWSVARALHSQQWVSVSVSGCSGKTPSFFWATAVSFAVPWCFGTIFLWEIPSAGSPSTPGQLCQVSFYKLTLWRKNYLVVDQ